MASSVALLEEDLSCPICFEDYNLDETDRMPKLLLCLHTVCFTCLENLLSDDETVRCPICRMDHEIDEDLEDLLDNDAVVTHIRLKQEEENKKAAMEIYWKEWLEKCSNDIPDEELRANIRDLVRNSLNPFDDKAKHPSTPEQPDLQRREQEKQEQQQQWQQIQQQHQRQIEHFNQQQRQVGQQQDFDQTEFLELLSQYLAQLHLQRNPRSPNEREDQHTNQHHEEVVERHQSYRQETGEGHNQHSNEAGEELHQHSQEAGEESQQDIQVLEWQPPSYELVELEDEDTSEEEVENHVQEQEDEDDYNYDSDDNFYYNCDGWEDFYDVDGDDDEEEDYDDDDDYDSDDEVEEVEPAPQAQPQQQQLQQQEYQHQQSQSNQPSTTVGRKIFITGDTVNKYADVALIRNGFTDIYGPVNSIEVFTGSDECPCSYSVLEFRNNVCFIAGEYKFGNQTFKARLCSGLEGKVFVARLPVGIDNDEIVTYFRKFGSLCAFHRPLHFITDNPVTYCFLTFEEEESAKEVLKFEDHYIDGLEFIVKPHVNRF